LTGAERHSRTNRKKYLVGRDAQNLCTCDSDLGSAFVGADAPITLSATFGAPPDVRAVDVFVPRFGTFKRRKDAARPTPWRATRTTARTTPSR